MGVRSAPTTQSWQNDLGKMLASTFGGIAGQQMPLGESAAGITADWTNQFATPVMQMWQREIAPMINEGYNLPGAFYSTSRSKGLAREAGNFFSGNVMPTLFSALENMRSRGPQWAGIWSGLLGQGAGLSTANTMENWYKPAMSSTERLESVSRSASNFGSLFPSVSYTGTV